MSTNKTILGGDIEQGSTNRHITGVQRKVSHIKGSLEVNGDKHTDQIDQWAASLTEILEDVPQYICTAGHPGRISRIPKNLREIDVKAYEPYFLSIGPYYHEKPSVQPMERRKWMVFKHFLQAKPSLVLKDYLEELRSIEPEARKFYSDVEMDSEKFVFMLLLDSIFFLSLFFGICETSTGVKNESTRDVTNNIDEGIRSGDDSESAKMMLREDELGETATREDETPRMYATLFIHDLFLIENQLPFFVLQKLHVLAYGGSKAQFTSIMKESVSSMLADYTKVDSKTDIMYNEEGHHLLHLGQMFFRPILQHESNTCQLIESSQMFRLGSAVQLYESGVKFIPRFGSMQQSLLDISFNSSGEMMMPCLCVEDNTNSLLRNLIALQQMKYPNLGLNVSAYAVLLLHLVTTPEDAQLLRRKGLIQHHLASDKEMMYLVNKLSVGLSFDYVEDMYSLKPVFQELKRYTERRRPRWKAWLKHRYFNNPWTTISLVAASILLLTIVQTYFTVYSYYQPCYDCH